MQQTAVADTRPLGLVGWGGLATMGAGALAITEVIVPAEGAAGSAIFLAFLILLLIGLIGFHRYQGHAYGRMTAAGLALVAIGAVAQAVATAGSIAGTEAMQPLDDLGSLAILLGILIYGGSTLRGRALPRWCGAAFLGGFVGWVILAIALGDAGGIVGGIWFGLLWLALGYALWTRRDTPTPRATSTP